MAQRNEPMFLDDSIFGEGVIVEIAPCQSFQANYSKLPALTMEVYNSIAVDEEQLDRRMTKEELSYYTTALLWLKLLEVKAKQSNSALTSEEEAIRNAVAEHTFNVPQPIYAYLREIGTYTDKMGREMKLDVPNLPTSRAGGHGGYHASTITDATHTLFEEVPSLGIAADMVMALTSPDPEPQVNFRVELPGHTTATANLAGNTSPIGLRRPEICQNLARFGITQDAFPEDVLNTRFNLKYIRYVSHLLGETETFRNEKVNFKHLTKSGGETQVIYTKPLTPKDQGRWIDREVQASASTSSSAHIGASYVFGFQLYKEDGPGTTETQRAANWCCVGPQPDVEWQIPQAWVENRNARRNVPEEIVTERFRGSTLEQVNIVHNVIQRMINTVR